MAVAAHPNWAGAIQLTSGKTFYFCSVRCTLAASLHPQLVLGSTPSAVKEVRVPNYLAPEQSLSAPVALFVVGSDIQGPMGPELVPAASNSDASVILKRHGGTVLHFSDVSDSTLQSLSNPKVSP
jgi:copper chaperone NosL